MDVLILDIAASIAGEIELVVEGVVEIEGGRDIS